MQIIQFKDLILFENADFIVINKPPHVATLDERTGDTISMLQLGRAYHESVQACHRLDKETSGALAFAKNPEAYRAMSMQFEHRHVTKIYHAVVQGMHTFASEHITLSVLPLPNGTVRIDRRGKDAETYFTTLRLFRQHSLVECKPVTGRMHQIRIHLSALKAPIVSDLQYGGQMLYLSSLKRKFNLKKDTEEQPLISRVALHARSLSFTLMDEKPVTVEAPYPKDFGVLVRQLEKND